MAIRAVVPSPDWSPRHFRGAAKCRDTDRIIDGDPWFEDEALALNVCNGDERSPVCPRRAECLRVAMINKENYGVWGGMRPSSRSAMRARYPGMPERWTWRPPDWPRYADPEPEPADEHPETP